MAISNFIGAGGQKHHVAGNSDSFSAFLKASLRFFSNSHTSHFAPFHIINIAAMAVWGEAHKIFFIVLLLGCFLSDSIFSGH